MTLSSSCSHTSHSKCTEEPDVLSLSLTQILKQRVSALVGGVGEKWERWRAAWFLSWLWLIMLANIAACDKRAQRWPLLFSSGWGNLHCTQSQINMKIYALRDGFSILKRQRQDEDILNLDYVFIHSSWPMQRYNCTQVHHHPLIRRWQL